MAKQTGGLLDNFHSLFVGPCERKAIRREKSCRPVEEVCEFDADQFNCSYDEWEVHCREAARQAAFSGWPGTADPNTILTDVQRAEAALAEQTLVPLDVCDDLRIEPRRQG
jgi:hypothetical protein